MRICYLPGRPVSLPVLLSALCVPLLFTQCKSSGSYKDIEYDPSTLKTPDGHGLEKKEYPFDDEGNYRKDWVRNKTKGRTRSSYDIPDEASAAQVDTEVAQAGNTAYPSDQDLASGGGAATSSSTEPAASSASAPRYHTVAPGDTLYSLANRYGTSVNELKRANGLTSDAIRRGQTLRVP